VTTWVDHLRRHAATQPERRLYTFLVDGEVEQATLTFGELDRRARALAVRLVSVAIPGDRVLLLCPAGLDYITAFFGTLYAGMIAVTAFEIDDARRAGGAERVRLIARDAGASVAITSGALDHGFDVPTIRCGEVDLRDADLWREPAITPATLALLQYTSGSTSAPRGVMLTHGNMLANAEIQRRSWRTSPHSVCVSWLPLYHDLGVLTCLLQPIYVGFAAVLMPPHAFLQRPARWLEAITRYRGTFAGGPNFAFELCARKVGEGELVALELSSWDVAFNGAEPVRASTIERFARRFARCGFRRDAMYPCYGLAEANFVSGATARGAPIVRGFDATALARGEARTPGTHELVGCGVAAQQLQIVDPDRAIARERGVVGEIWVRGPSVGVGYWQRADDAATAFGARIGGEDAWFRTGDLGFLDADGELFVTGRRKDLIIVRGANHYPQDIELTVERAHDSVRPGCGAAFSIERDDREVVVVVQEVSATGTDLAGVITAIRARVATQHGLEVGAVALVRAGTIPKTTSGKLQRSATRDAFLANQLAVVARWERPVVRSSAQLETRLAASIAARVGGPVAVDVPFVDLGIDSLAAVELSGELEAWLGVPVSPTVLYAFPTIRELARALVIEPPAATAAPHRDGNEPIAIVGIGCRFAGARDARELWAQLEAGRDAVTDAPAARGLAMSSRAGWIDDVDRFDAAFFGISPREAVQMDPQHRVILEVAWEALEDAGLPAERLSGAAAGVFVGITTADHLELHAADTTMLDVHSASGRLATFAANRISYALDLRGPSVAIDTACSSSLVAVHQACASLRAGESTVALAGGVNLILADTNRVVQTRLGALAPDGTCKPFDARADGYVRAEGAAIVVMKPLSRALGDGDRIYAVIRGSAVNQDGRSNGITAPNPRAQEALLRDAYARAGIEPSRVSFIEAHGSGTALGDRVEAGALGAVIGAGRERPCPIGSVKSNLGHAEAAAGIAGLVKAVLAIHHRQLPASLHCRVPNPQIPFARLGLIVQQEMTKLDGHLVAGVSSFGLGGTNAHVVLEQAPVAPQRTARARDVQIVPLSARDPDALVELAARLRERTDLQLADLAWTASARRSHHAYRAAIVARTIDELRDKLARVARPAAPSRARRVAWVFSGHGGQWSGMGRGLCAEPAFAEALATAGLAIARAGGPEIDALIATTDDRWLTRTELVQPMLFAWQVAMAALLRAWGIEPVAIVGHSVGELAAVASAGALSVDDAARVVVLRSQLLARTAGRGAMLVVGLDEAATRAVIADEPEIDVAACNSATSTVVSGASAAIARVQHVLAARDVFVRAMPIDGAAHGPLVEPFVAELVAGVTTIRPHRAEVALYSTVTGGAIEGTALEARYWGRNLRAPVQLAKAIHAMADIDTFVEIGPHPVLAPILPGEALAVSRRDRDELELVLDAAARIYALGGPVDLTRIPAGEGELVDLPRYPFRRTRHWLAPAVLAGRREHPLLGTRRDRPDEPGVCAWESEISLHAQPYLADHALAGCALVPGLLFAQLALEAGRQLDLGPIVLESLEVQRALFVREGERHVLQVIVTPDERGAGVAIHSRREGERTWTAHGVARLVRAVPRDDGVAPSRDGMEPFDGASFYAELRGRGNEFGARFRGVTGGARGHGEAIADVRLPGGLALEGGALHPALLDACAHALLAAAPLRGEAMVPIAIERIWIAEGVDAPLVAHARVRAASNTTLAGDVEVRDATGRVVVRIEGARLRTLDEVDALGYALAWQVIDEPPAARGDAGGWAIVADAGDPMATSLATSLRARGAACSECAPTSLAPGVVGVVYLAPACAGEDVRSGHLRCGEGAAQLVRTLGRLDAPPRLWIVTRGGVVVRSGERPALAHAGLWGLGAAIAAEHPELWGGLVDLDPSRDDTDAIAAHVIAGGEPHVALRDGRRHGLRLRRDAVAATPPPRLRRDATYLVTGGLGGIGLAVARWLASCGARRLVLVGRRPVSPRATWSALPAGGRDAAIARATLELENEGVHVDLVALDLADDAALRAFLDDHRRDGRPPIRGIVHAAAASSLNALEGVDEDDLGEHFDPKAGGALALDRLFPADSLDLFVMFSSTTATFGAPRLASYAAANAVVDALAHDRRARGGHALAVQWGMWQDAGMAARLQAEGTRAWHVGQLATAEALGVLGNLMTSGRAHAVVQRMDWPEYARAYPHAAALPVLSELVTRPTPSPRDRTPTDEPLETYLARSVARTLRIAAAEAASDIRLDALGFDSLMAVELRTQLAEERGIHVPLPWLLERPTIAELAARVRASRFTPGRTRDARTIVSADAARIACWETGSGPPLVLVHGGFDDHTQWDGVVEQLAERFSVIAMDRRGCGASDPWRDGHCIEREIEDVLAVVEQRPGCVLAAHSIGALHALEAAARGAPIRALVLYEPPVAVAPPPADRLDELDERWRAGDHALVASALGAWIVGLGGRSATRVSSWKLSVAPGTRVTAPLRALAGYAFDRTRVRAIDVPTSLLVGEHTGGALRTSTELLAAALPTARTVVLPGQAHDAVTTAPRVVAEALHRAFPLDLPIAST
jgi:acyl transferase domain-containing protein/acyl-CoA synthetase (AMP-forming)/AMP-acid ligase II/acyl carrier protein